MKLVLSIFATSIQLDITMCYTIYILWVFNLIFLIRI